MTPTGAKKSGWGDSPTKEPEGNVAPSRRRRGAKEEAPTEEQPKNVHSMDDDDDEPAQFIPDLEDETENLAMQVAAPSTVQTARLPTLEELNRAIEVGLPSTSEAGVNLAMLQAYLTPQDQVVSP